MLNSTLVPTRRRLNFYACATLAWLGLALLASSSASAADQTKKVLFLTKSTGFQHSVVTRDPKNPTKLAHAEQVLVDFGAAHGFEVTITKDADVFNDPETYKKYDVFAFYTTEDLTKDSNKKIHTEKPMSAEGKKMFLEALASGKGYIGFHCASDTFHSKNSKNPDLLRSIDVKDPVDPYIAAVGGEFAGHGSQQKSAMRVADKNFPGIEGLEDFTLNEEWYSLKNLAPDMHVLLVQDTNTMVNGKGQREPLYNRAPYPATWARMEGKGRVFYTSMGHREDVWTNPIFQKVLLAGLNWSAGNTQADLTPNMEKAAPQK
jgi:hypothetical protein